MTNLTQFYIGGAWVDPLSDATMPVLNPATEAQIGTLALGNEADVDAAVAAANAAFPAFSQTTKAERLALLDRLLVETKARFEDLAQAMSREMGAPITNPSLHRALQNEARYALERPLTFELVERLMALVHRSRVEGQKEGMLREEEMAGMMGAFVRAMEGS